VLIFTETPLQGAYIVDIAPARDSRGYFARAFCRGEFLAHGLDPEITQINMSFNPRAGTLRGLHYQSAPCEEAKLVRCSAGKIFDVIVDIREGSKTYAQWFAIELSPENGRSLYIPKDFAHGYLTLENDTTVLYNVSAAYSPEHSCGIYYADPAIGITWPEVTELIISEKDRVNPCLK
jgi:dTDP-4-dehydrorhamnose 3,5-epimerase